MERDAFAHGKGDRLAILGDFPAFREVGHIAFAQVHRIEIDQAAIDVADDITARKLERFCRIKRRDVVNAVRDYQHVCGGIGKNLCGGHGNGGGCDTEDCACHHRAKLFHLILSCFLREGTAKPLPPRVPVRRIPPVQMESRQHGFKRRRIFD